MRRSEFVKWGLALSLVFCLVGCDKGKDDWQYTQSDIVKAFAEYTPLISELKESSGDYSPLCLCFFTDLHGHIENLRRIMACATYFSACVDDVLCAGDMQLNSFNDDFSFWGNYADSVVHCVGNHDTAEFLDTSFDFKRHVGIDAYNKYYRMYLPLCDVVQPNAPEVTGKCYFYKDYPNSRMRLVILDCMSYDNSQDEWFRTILNECLTLGLGVVAVSHFQPADAIPIDCSFTEYTFVCSRMVPADGLDISEIGRASVCVDDFIERGGDFLCWLCGHNHRDAICYLPNHHNQVIIVSEAATCDAIQVSSSCSKREYGGKSQDSFDFISFDVENRLCKLVKIGATEDMYGRTKRMMCLNLNDLSFECRN